MTRAPDREQQKKTATLMEAVNRLGKVRKPYPKKTVRKKKRAAAPGAPRRPYWLERD